jgi:hypothetical protein
MRALAVNSVFESQVTAVEQIAVSELTASVAARFGR